ncbi:MAG: permease [Pirellulales bacterium]|nr:permease [Pirellulales bacterium]
MIPILVSSWNVLLDLATWLLLGALVAGVLHVLLPADFLKRYLSGSHGVLRAVVLGVPLPLCSCGVIPVGISLKSGGASNGAVVGFLISTPQTGVDSIFVSASLLGWPFAIFKLASAAIMGLLGGWLTDSWVESPPPVPVLSESSQPQRKNHVAVLLAYAVEVIHSVWRWLVIGILVSAAIDVFVPSDALSSLAAYGGLLAMLATLLIAIPLYVCATASVPIAAALVAAGMPTGAALVFLIAGPATNVATLGAVYKTLGRKPLLIYLTLVLLGSIVCGWTLDFVLDTDHVTSAHDHLSATWWNIASATILLVLFIWFAAKDVMQLGRRNDSSCCAD